MKNSKEKLIFRVSNMLRKDMETRNDDRILTIRVWQSILPAGTDSITFEQLFDLPDQSSIKRMRAHLQNKLKLYPPTKAAVAKQRRWNKKEWEKLLELKLW